MDKVIMILDEDPAFCKIYQKILGQAGYHVMVASGRKSGLSLLTRKNPQAVFTEIKLNGSSDEGICFIEEALLERPNLTIIVVSSEDNAKIINKALDRGAADYLVKPSPDRIESPMQKIIETMEEEIRLKTSVEKDGGLAIGPGRMIIGKSQSMWRVYKLIQKVADDRSSALILGESGAGKELIAQAIHARKEEQTPFVSIDCGCIPKTLLESELFGVRENYPGMHNKERLVGKLEVAGAGTLLLDEIGNMNVDLQASLLRVLQEREFRPLGREKPVPLRAQVVASTNVDLDSAIDEGRFRNDLYYRLNAVKIILPPLHQRKEDIPLLVRYYLDRHEKQSGRKVEVLPQAMDRLTEYHWPGNIRELFHTLQRALTLYPSRYLASGYFDLPSSPLEGRGVDATAPDDLSLEDLHRLVNGYEKEVLLKTLEGSGWNQTKAAEKLKLTRTNLIWKMKKYGLRKKTDGKPRPNEQNRYAGSIDG